MIVLLIKELFKGQRVNAGWCICMCVRVPTGKSVFSESTHSQLNREIFVHPA